MTKPKRDSAGLMSGLGRLTGLGGPKIPDDGQPPPQVGAPLPPSRKGKAGILTWHDPAVAQQLKMLSAEKSITQQKLVAEALNMLFAKYGKAQIA